VGQINDFAAIFIESDAIFPDETGLILKSLPSFEIRDTGWWVSAVNALDELLDAFERYWVFNGVIILFESARWQVDERNKYLQIIPKNGRQLVECFGVGDANTRCSQSGPA